MFEEVSPNKNVFYCYVPSCVPQNSILVLAHFHCPHIVHIKSDAHHTDGGSVHLTEHGTETGDLLGELARKRTTD